MKSKRNNRIGIYLGVIGGSISDCTKAVYIHRDSSSRPLACPARYQFTSCLIPRPDYLRKADFMIIIIIIQVCALCANNG